MVAGPIEFSEVEHLSGAVTWSEDPGDPWIQIGVTGLWHLSAEIRGTAPDPVSGEMAIYDQDEVLVRYAAVANSADDPFTLVFEAGEVFLTEGWRIRLQVDDNTAVTPQWGHFTATLVGACNQPSADEIGGGWTLSAGDNDPFSEGAYRLTTGSYALDQDDRIETLVVSGLNDNISEVELQIMVNEVEAYSASLPVTGSSYSQTFDVGVDVFNGDLVRFNLVASIDPGETITLSEVFWTGLIPMIPDAIGSGNEYQIHTLTGDFIGPGSTTYDFDDPTFPGTDAPLSVPGDSYGYTSTTSFGATPFPGVSQIYGNATPGLTTAYTIDEVGFVITAAGTLIKTITSNLTDYAGDAAFPGNVDTVTDTSPGNMTISWFPGFDTDQTANTSGGPINLSMVAEILHTEHITSAVMHLAGTHVDGTIDWETAG